MKTLPSRVVDALKGNGRLILPAVQQLVAEAWDEGHNHCFRVEDPTRNDRNPYRSPEKP